ncbi:MAG: DotU family type IV/VI secretion system protein [Chitinispirillia bacterium]|nr:DotU family type IV/VI secretion system protein [Chitinispirillia bacterium]MCL2242086.1 DotU family type IV/VI secretion system protein [Chitinispirillia bacterium]
MKTVNHGGYQYPRAAIGACAEAVVIVSGALKQSSAYNLADLHGGICAKFDFVIRQCRADSLPESAALELLYPLAALADETFLSVPQYRYYWSERPLQLRYFGEAAAGAKLFSRLEAHMGAHLPKKEVLEQYFIALALGLRGMYGVDGTDISRRRQKIFEDLGDMLRNIRKSESEAAASAAVDKGGRMAPGMVVPAVLAGLASLMIAVAAAVYLISRANLLKLLEQF